MGRRTSFGSVVNRSLKAMAREAARAEKAAAREYKARQREYEKQQKLDNKINKMESACSFSGTLPVLNIDFLSLKKDSYFLAKMQSLSSLYSNLDKNILIDVVNYIKLGDRNSAINFLKDETNLDYNQIICLVGYIENDLYKLLKENEDCWFEDKLGKYEFLPPNSLFEIDADVDYDTAKSEVEIQCIPLDESETIIGKDPSVVKNKISKALEKLNKKWIQRFSKYHLEREEAIVNAIKEEQISLLKYVVSNEIDVFDYENLKDKSLFVSKLPKIKKPKRELLDMSELSNNLQVLDEQKPTDENTEFLIWEKWLNNLFLYDKMEARRVKRYTENLSKWENEKLKLENELESVKTQNVQRENEYQSAKERYNEYLKAVEQEKENFLSEQNTFNKAIDERIKKFNNKDIYEMKEYFKNSLMLSTYPILWKKEINLSYNQQTKTLVTDYKLPMIEEIYNIDKVNLSVSKNEFNTVLMKDKKLNQIYNDILYQICLRTVYEIFSIDTELDTVDTVKFNGIISAADKAMGKEKTVCILSLIANDENLSDIDFGNVESKQCFKALKGVGGEDLSSITAININETEKISAQE